MRQQGKGARAIKGEKTLNCFTIAVLNFLVHILSSTMSHIQLLLLTLKSTLIRTHMCTTKHLNLQSLQASEESTKCCFV